MLAKSSIQLNLTTNNVTFLPGDTIQGSLRVVVAKAVETTAVRIKVSALEKASVRVRRGKQTATYRSETLHFEQSIVAFGSTKASGRKGGATLQPGTYDYPFQVTLPTTLPPSYAVATGNGGSTLEYRIKAYADIPFGFDAEEVYPFHVLSCVPGALFEPWRATPVNHESTAVVYSCSFCGFFCCQHKDANITTRLDVLGRVAILRGGTEGVQHGQPQRIPLGEVTVNNVPMQLPAQLNTVRVRVTVKNLTQSDRIGKVEVSLTQQVQLNVRGYSSMGFVQLATSVFVPAADELQPGGSATFDSDLVIDENMGRVGKFNGKPIPTMVTSIMTSTCFLEVKFPGLAAENTLCTSGHVQLVNAVDYSNRVPANPTTYTSVSIMPELLLGQC